MSRKGSALKLWERLRVCFELCDSHFSTCLAAMAAHGHQTMADLLEAEGMSAARVNILESQVHMLGSTKRAKARQLKGEKQKQTRLVRQAMLVANRTANLEDELSSLQRVKEAKAKELKNEKAKQARIARKIAAAAAGVAAVPGGAA